MIWRYIKYNVNSGISMKLLPALLFIFTGLQIAASDHDLQAAAGDKNNSWQVIFRDNFKNLKNWWIEGGQSVTVRNGKLYVKADPVTFDKGKNGGVCTVWNKIPVSGNVKIDFDVCVISSKTNVNNINLFLFFSDPTGPDLQSSAGSRKSADYPLYHNLNGYIFTYLNDAQKRGPVNNDGSTKARFRIRRCPGFNLLTQAYDYHAEKNKIYHISIIRRDKMLSIAVDGKIYLKASDETPFKSGYWGFRTFRTWLWFGQVTVSKI